MRHDKSITVPQRDLVRLTDVPREGQKRHFECSICCYVGTVPEGDAAYRKVLERARDAHCPKGETSIQRAVETVPKGETSTQRVVEMFPKREEEPLSGGKRKVRAEESSRTEKHERIGKEEEVVKSTTRMGSCRRFPLKGGRMWS